MTGPDFDEIIEGETDAGQRERLEHVHGLLTAADAPPNLPAALAGPPSVRTRLPRSHRRLQLALGFAAALVFAAFAVGYLVGDRSDRFEAVAAVSMHGFGETRQASGMLEIGERDAAGNVPIEMRVEGLPPLTEGGWYELELSKGGRPLVSCGTFTTGGGETAVRLSVGYALNEWREAGRYDGWVVTAHIPGNPAASDRVLLTT
jgi:hypothetical protein